MTSNAIESFKIQTQNKIKSRTNSLARKLTTPQIKDKAKVATETIPEAVAVMIPTATYVKHEVVDLTHSSPSPTRKKKTKLWSPTGYLRPKKLAPNSLLRLFDEAAATANNRRFRAKVECTITIDDGDDEHSIIRMPTVRKDSSSEEEFDL